ncbi:HSP20-like chaperone [Tricharina praecox]|uniref:HSP20-like chaperone n=1 Tax=Tricharina praecox TaxID=43433 RepID=UPI00221F8B08|nr:HSP20-like chaperone [Tricharina praecox]KAI5854571.1 HSP20-like chaperone [Tricharina praecox]
MPIFACPVPTQQHHQQQQRQQRMDPYLEAILSQLSGHEDSQSSQHKPTSTTHSSAPRPTPTPRQHNRSNRAFTPRFDVYETADAYHLDGDLPGVSDKTSIGIEFSDERTLSISGRVSRIRQPVEEKHEENKKGGEESTTMERRRSLQPTVEDTDDEDDFSIVSHTSNKKSSEQQQVAKSEGTTTKPAGPETKTWVTERTFGNFQRTFNFPTPVDLEKVTAKLEAGLLQIVVPKRVFGGARKIQIA